MKILVAQSGGPTAVINATLTGVIERARDLGYEVIGGLHGVEGILESKSVDLSTLSGKMLNSISHTPGAYLGSCRYNLPQPPDGVYDVLFNFFNSNKIDAFLYIGGNDSMDSVEKISKEAQRRKYPLLVGGIPKTVDNDLVETDHCPGYPSAAKFLNVIASEFVVDSMAYSKPVICIIETMGRDSGWLASSLKMVEKIVDGLKVMILIPELPVSEEKLLDTVNDMKSPLLISVSEGIINEEGKYLSALETVDNFGHPKLGGAGEHVATLIEKIAKVKFMNPAFSQRAATHIISEVDYREAKGVGAAAVDTLAEGKNAFFVGIERVQASIGYSSTIRIVSIDRVANEVRKVPESLFENEFIDYIAPLIGKLPKYAFRR
jgi:6-phosphofructokinase|uniref:Pyrophosphate--fructose 6-phosphate 1-phosphotransferase n=1 Tax=Mesoaciditoga lauensis TaxID=1495039 RepID=A0A7V3RE04_9BACT